MNFVARLLTSMAGLSLVVLTNSAGAQTKMLPGLWEHSVTIQDNGGQMSGAMKQMQEQMAKMTPAQRAQMEQMMGGGKGMSMGPGSGSATAVKMCMTQAQIDLNEGPPPEKNCMHQVTQRSGNSIKMKFSCAGDHPTTGESEVTVLSPTAYKGKSVVNTMMKGKPERMNMEQSGKWLSADCGNIKPISPPKK